MAGFVLPTDAKELYAKLAAMPADQYSRFLKFISALPTESVFSITLDRLLDTQEASDRPLFFGAINHLARLSRSAQSLGISADEAVTSVGSQTIGEEDSARTALETRLKELLSQRSINIHFRAWELLYEEERCATGSSILTDIRPIFNATGEAVEGHIIVNHLHIRYTEHGVKRNIFFAIDERDIEQLIEISERAKKKITALKAYPVDSSVAPRDP